MIEPLLDHTMRGEAPLNLPRILVSFSIFYKDHVARLESFVFSILVLYYSFSHSRNANQINFPTIHIRCKIISTLLREYELSLLFCRVAWVRDPNPIEDFFTKEYFLETWSLVLHHHKHLHFWSLWTDGLHFNLIIIVWWIVRVVARRSVNRVKCLVSYRFRL